MSERHAVQAPAESPERQLDGHGGAAIPKRLDARSHGNATRSASTSVPEHLAILNEAQTAAFLLFALGLFEFPALAAGWQGHCNTHRQRECRQHR